MIGKGVPQEAEANRFASQFLMPDGVFKKDWEHSYGLPLVERVLKIKRIFKVSYRTVLFRLIEDELYPASLWQKFQVEYRRQFGKTLLKTGEPFALNADSFRLSMPETKRANEPSEMDKRDFIEGRLWRLVRQAVEQEQITHSRAAEILRLKLPQMRKIAAAW